MALEFQDSVRQAMGVDTNVGTPEQMKLPKIPNIAGVTDSTETVSGDMAQAVVQFLTGFGAAGSAIKGAGVASTIGKTLFSEFAAFDGHEKNLANLIEAVPALQNPITGFLAEKEETPEVVDRLKNTLANGVAAAAVEPMLAALRSIKAKRLAEELAGQTSARDVADGLDEGSIGTPAANAQDMAGRVKELMGEPQVAPPRAGLEDQAAGMLPETDMGVDPAYAAASMMRTAMDGEWRPPADLVEEAAKRASAPKKTGNVFADSVLHRTPSIALDEEDLADVMEAAAIRYSDFKWQGGRPTSLDYFERINPQMVNLSTKFDRETAKDLVYAALKEGSRAVGGELSDIEQLPANAIEAFLRRTFGKDKGPTEPPDILMTPPPVPTLGRSAAPQGATGQTPVNWNRIETTDDVKSIMGQMVDAFPEDFKTSGRQSFDDVKFSAENENAWGVLLGKRQTPLTNAAETLAMRRLWTSSGRKLRELAAAAATGGQAEAFAFRRMVAVHRTIQSAVKDIRTEQARALAQWRIPAGEGAEQVAQMDEILRMTGGMETTQAMARAIADLASRPGVGASKVEAFVERSGSVKTVESLLEAWKAALLSGPQTHIVNAMSNAIVIPLALAERNIAARIGDVLDPVSGVKFGEAALMQQAMRDHTSDLLRVFWHGMKTGEQIYGGAFKEADRAGLLGQQYWRRCRQYESRSRIRTACLLRVLGRRRRHAAGQGAGCTGRPNPGRVPRHVVDGCGVQAHLSWSRASGCGLPSGSRGRSARAHSARSQGGE